MELTVENVSALSSAAIPAEFPGSYGFMLPSFGELIAYTGLAVIGVFGVLLELFILHRTRSDRNKKYVFMLRCLATNDCIVMVGVLGHMLVSDIWPNTRRNVWSCRIRIVWRFFAMCSGCVAIAMTIERWLAITNPFFYRKVRARVSVAYTVRYPAF
ncbi:uncharacterized protein LOC113554408 isoform X1 [Rhopalosiphum maidis]|uniref:uncharacterized protein LOC113554408 isoform X1 n=1 Tax=Rhopalosiphum maidis TaxID=43146 RepID=UPI000F00C1D5|nr:uncharacterized protein LOC113554408 isoform X1 [Rhopalosiphum maidis]